MSDVFHVSVPMTITESCSIWTTEPGPNVVTIWLGRSVPGLSEKSVLSDTTHPPLGRSERYRSFIDCSASRSEFGTIIIPSGVDSTDPRR